MQKKAIATTKKIAIRALKLTAKAAAAVIESAKSLAVANSKSTIKYQLILIVLDAIIE